jgi:hypothetical protein
MLDQQQTDNTPGLAVASGHELTHLDLLQAVDPELYEYYKSWVTQTIRRYLMVSQLRYMNVICFYM